MKKIISLIIVMVFAFATAVPAGMVEELEPVERELILIDKKEEAPRYKKKKRSWIPWVFGLVLIGGGAAIGLGGSSTGDDNGGGGNGGDTGTIKGSW